MLKEIFLWGTKINPRQITQEESDCLRDWNNFMIFRRLPHELGYADECYHEDLEALKTMQKWSEMRAERERKKEEMKRRTHEKVRSLR